MFHRASRHVMVFDLDYSNLACCYPLLICAQVSYLMPRFFKRQKCTRCYPATFGNKRIHLLLCLKHNIKIKPWDRNEDGVSKALVLDLSDLQCLVEKLL